MKKSAYTLVSLILAAFSFTACETKENLNSDNVGVFIKTLSSVIDDKETKVALSGSDDDGYNLLWTKGARIAVVDTRDNGASDIYVLKNGTGTRYGTFTCEGMGVKNIDYSVYPADILSIDDAFHADIVWPEVQKYDPDKVFCPMYGVPQTDTFGKTVLRFKHLGGFMRLSVTGCSSIKRIRITADRNFTGIGNYLYLSESVSATVFGPREISLDCGEGVDVSGGRDFYVAMPADVYSDIKIECYDADNDVVWTRKLKDGVSFEVKKGQITQVSVNILPYVKVNGADGCQTYLNDDTSLHCLGAIPGTVVTVTAAPEPGFTFIGWDDGSRENPKYVTIRDKNVTYTPILALSGGYKISETSMVHFSKGNLEFDVKSGEWGFAKNQYDCAEGFNSDRISLFTWGYGAWSTDPSTESCESGEFRDWGAAIDNRGTWRTLNHEEWEYLAAHHNKTWSSVLGHPGYILEPEGFVGEVASSYSDEASWRELESAGCIFLPAAGYRTGSRMSNDAGRVGYYWTSDMGSYDDNAFQLYVTDGYFEILEYLGMRYHGCSVRLVNDMDR